MILKEVGRLPPRSGFVQQGFCIVVQKKTAPAEKQRSLTRKNIG